MKENLLSHSCFSQSYKVDNCGIIANFVFPYICSFLLYFLQLFLVNVKLEIKGYMRIIFEGQLLLVQLILIIAEPNRSWQCWHSCVA